jgi:type IV pilus assembly protein PilA
MQAPPKKGLSGCAITAIVGVVLAVVSVPVLGILAAIALPAYQQYVVRSQIASVLPKLQPLQQAIDDYQASHGACPPDNATVGVSPTLSYGLDANATRSAIVRVSTTPLARCGVVVSFRNVTALPPTATLTLESDNGQWRCSANVADTLLPPQCRAGTAATP